MDYVKSIDRAEEDIMSLMLLIRADASVSMGSGHIMRCIALAQAWQTHDGEVIFLSHNELPDALAKRINEEGFTVITHAYPIGKSEDTNHLIKVARQYDAHTIVIDGYHFGAEYQKQVKDAGLQSLFIDDNGHADHYYADFMLNQNIHANEQLYANREPYTQLLLGTQYTLLRREFWAYRNYEKIVADVAQNILITMGGSDADNITLKILQIIEQLLNGKHLHIKAVVGGSNPHLNPIIELSKNSELNIDILHNVMDMPKLMEWADVAISAGGSTVWELCMMGVPTIIIITASNQQQAMKVLADLTSISVFDLLTEDVLNFMRTYMNEFLHSKVLREAIASKLRNVIDGYGVDKVIESIQA